MIQGTPDDDVLRVVERLEQLAPIMSPAELEIARNEIAAVLAKRKRTQAKLDLVGEAIADDWNSTRQLRLLQALVPPRVGARVGTKVPEGWLTEIASRCPPEKITTVAREIVERECPNNLTGADRKKWVKNQADYLRRLSKRAE